MSHRTTSSLDDTIPLDKEACKLGLSDSNQTYYGSDISLPSEEKSGNSSIEIVISWGICYKNHLNSSFLLGLGTLLFK